ncbi:MAG: undecaprenyldiphospho-muramoylpentapeptide beta-N-acetylglucosaminyltransferase [Verrucomicrobia bacterium]|nr:undecaprenyldiphospho-muramoylpentapeptide beta-N-acetylglucosaminyltransferase [Verrucomicrobiota bacterium]
MAIACGGTGGHLFPGLAVAHQLIHHGCAVTLLVSPKEVDQLAVRQLSTLNSPLSTDLAVATLPAVGLTRGRWIGFVRGSWQSYRAAQKLFRARPPQAVLAMGGFTSAPPIWAAQKSQAATYLHESNTIPGKANRWLARKVDQAFVGFPAAASLLPTRKVLITGTPVRPQFRPRDPGACRAALGLDAQRPVLLVMGGSQGANAINELILQMLPRLAERAPQLQLLHLTGSKKSQRVTDACATHELKAVVVPFLAEMELALGAATVAINRAGASSLAELAAMRVPSVLIPLPGAADNHQFYNARAFEETGAARLLEQRAATPEKLLRLILELVENAAARERMQTALASWHSPRAAEQIAECMLAQIGNHKLELGEWPSHLPPAISPLPPRQTALT